MKKKVKDMEELTKGFDEFAKKKELNKDNKEQLEELLKEVVKPDSKDNQK